MFTFLMFLVLIALYVAMIGFVKFSEDVIGMPQLAPSGDGTATKIIGNTESL